MAERLDDDRLELLRQWGGGLAAESHNELRAAGKAILLLVDEIERLQVDVWNGRMAALEPDSSQVLATTLRDRLTAARRVRHS